MYRSTGLYTYVYLCLRSCTHTHIHDVHGHLFVHVSVYVCGYVYVHVHGYVCIHTSIRLCVYMFVDLYSYVHMFSCCDLHCRFPLNYISPDELRGQHLRMHVTSVSMPEHVHSCMQRHTNAFPCIHMHAYMPAHADAY